MWLIRKKPLVSIVIPVYNGVVYTKECLQSLRHFTTVSSEIIVVDNASTDETPSFLKTNSLRTASISTIHVIRNKINLGYAKACNQGFRKSSGKHIVFLNNDTIVTPKWLEPLLACFITEPLTGMATPKLIYPESRQIQYAGVAFLKNTLPYILHYRTYDKIQESTHKEVPGAGGACMVLKRAVLEQIGQFDESFINGLEDIDLSLRLRQAGYKNIYCPSSTIYHHESKTEGRTKHDNENIQTYLNKWGNKIRITDNGDVLFYQ